MDYVDKLPTAEWPNFTPPRWTNFAPPLTQGDVRASDLVGKRVVGKQTLGSEYVAKHLFLGSLCVAEKHVGLQGRTVVPGGQSKNDVCDLVEDGEALALFPVIAVDDDDVFVLEPGRLTGLVVS